MLANTCFISGMRLGNTWQMNKVSVGVIQGYACLVYSQLYNY